MGRPAKYVITVVVVVILLVAGGFIIFGGHSNTNTISKTAPGADPALVQQAALCSQGKDSAYGKANPFLRLSCSAWVYQYEHGGTLPPSPSSLPQNG